MVPGLFLCGALVFGHRNWVMVVLTLCTENKVNAQRFLNSLFYLSLVCEGYSAESIWKYEMIFLDSDIDPNLNDGMRGNTFSWCMTTMWWHPAASYTILNYIRGCGNQRALVGVHTICGIW